MLMLGKQCHKPDHTYGLMVYSTHKNCDDLGMVYSCFNNINLKLGYCGIVTPYIHHHSSDGEQWGRYILPIATWNVEVVYWSKPWDKFHSASWKFHHQTSCVFSPPARWGLLDFIRAVLLLLRLRILSSISSASSSPPPHPPPLSPPPPPPRSPDPSGHSRTSTASARSQWALPDLHRELKIPVGTAGPQPRLPGRSGHCRTSTATSRSQWALPDLNQELQIPVGTAGPQRPDRMPEDMPDRMPEDVR